MYKSFIAGAAGLALLIASRFHWLPPFTTQLFWIAVGFTSLVILAFSGSYTFKSAFKALLSRRTNMHTLIALGTGCAWLYSMIMVLQPDLFPPEAQHVYFESALIIIALVTFGHTLEMHARRRTSNALEQLMMLQPKTANVIRDHKEIKLPIEKLVISDLVQVRPGEKIPLDGVITEGESLIDESMISGEPIPVIKGKNAEVTGGTINKTGAFTFAVTRIGKNTVLTQIISLVKAAQKTKPPIGQLADTVTSFFIPAVILIALLTAIIWFFFGPEPKATFMIITAMSVLIIAYPCALRIAAPISIVAGMDRAAYCGVLFKDARTLQTASQLTTLVLDKTGTITEGHPMVIIIKAQAPWDENTLLQITASVEKNSEHPLGQAIVEAAEQHEITLLPAEAFKAIPGFGVHAKVGDHTVLIGSEKLLMQRGISIEQHHNDTSVYIAVDGKYAGMMTVSDPIKKQTKEVISMLKKLKIELIMVTGDNQLTAKNIADSINIEHVFAEISSEKKCAKIKSLQSEGEIVGMVGDGINDAPALSQAHVGFAIGAGTDVAIGSADITLIGSSLHAVIDAINISKMTMRNIRQNLFFAFIYNILGIPIAAGLLYPSTGTLLNPMIAAGAMTLSSLTVLLNGFRISVAAKRQNLA